MDYRGLGLVAMAALAALTISSPNVVASTIFSDGDFSNWTTQVVFSHVTSSGSSTRNPSGGNPDAFLEVTQSTPGGAIGLFHAPQPGASDPFVYDPGVSSAIESLDFSIDFQPIQGYGAYQAFYPSLTQGGNVYLAGGANMSGTSGWNNFSRSLTQDNFYLITGTTSYAIDSSQHPVFGSSGSAITFGLLTTNNLSGTIVAGYDNYSLTVYPVPEPCTLAALLSMGTTGFLIGARRRRWRKGRSHL